MTPGQGSKTVRVQARLFGGVEGGSEIQEEGNTFLGSASYLAWVKIAD